MQRLLALSALSAQGLGEFAPCPANFTERAATIAEGEQFDRAAADATALANPDA